MKRKKITRGYGILFLLNFVLLLACLINSGIAILTVYFLVHSGVMTLASAVEPDVEYLILWAGILAFAVGIVVSAMVVKFPMKPIRDLIDGMDRLASGDFATRVNAGNIMRNYEPFVEASESFNKMAQELERTELLRSDFINNFSHEFKTPIMSIAGFARLLKRGNLSDEVQQEYLTAIEEESLRLAAMATNVLNLTKVENQSILTDVSRFNLSEQIRDCVLLLENRWEKKELELQMDFQEYFIEANEELLKQVWINLLDNAVKFAPEKHTVQVKIEQNNNEFRVRIMNTGSEIPREKQHMIFNKFYQADESHASEGNGIGLAIVKQIVQLHGGSVSVWSGGDVTVFTACVPVDQKH